MSNDLTSSLVLSFEDLYNSLSSDDLSKLYPKMNDNDVEKYADSIMMKPKNAFEKFSDLEVKPIIRSIDLNEGEEDAKPKSAWQIGLEILF